MPIRRSSPGTFPSFAAMKKNEMRLGCVIMASGLGRRFGGNKLMAPFLGKPMILHALQATSGLFDRYTVVTRHADVAQLCRGENVHVILHDLPHRSDTIRLGLQNMIGEIDGCMFCPGDQPLLSRESLMRLLDAFAHEPECIHVLGDGMPAIFPAWSFDALLHLPQGKGGNYVRRMYPEQVRSTKPLFDEELMDADTTEALEILEAYAKQQR